MVYTMNKPDVAASIAANLSHILGRRHPGYDGRPGDIYRYLGCRDSQPPAELRQMVEDCLAALEKGGCSPAGLPLVSAG